MTKVKNHLHIFVHRRNRTKDDYLKDFNAYIKVIKSYVGRKPIHTGLIKDKLSKMGVRENNDLTSEKNEENEGEVKEEYLEYLILDRAENGHFSTIMTDLENNMACESESFPRTKDKTVGIINNYHGGKTHTLVMPMKKEVSFSQTRSDTNISKTNKKE